MAKGSLEIITCKAAVCWGPEQPLTVEEIQVEPPKSSEIRIKMLYSSLCHTDLLYAKGFAIPLYPRVLGHEGVGVVNDVGEGVTDIKEGDIIIPTYLTDCQECENCKSELTNLCPKYPFMFHGLMSDGTSRMSVKGTKLYHMLACSTWSEYMVIDSKYVVKVDPTMNLGHASFLSCGFSTGFGGSWKEAKVHQGSSVAVFGLGAVGLGAVEGARLQGATRIIGIDINEKKKEKGEIFGMTDFINPNQSDKSISELIKEMTGGLGVDYSLECTGAPSLLNEALESTKLGLGKTIAIGAGNEMSLNIGFMSIMSGRTLKGSVFGGIKVKTDLPILLDKCINKEFNLDELLTHEIKLEDIAKAFDILKQPDCVKVLIKI